MHHDLGHRHKCWRSWGLCLLVTVVTVVTVLRSFLQDGDPVAVIAMTKELDFDPEPEQVWPKSA